MWTTTFCLHEAHLDVVDFASGREMQHQRISLDGSAGLPKHSHLPTFCQAAQIRISTQWDHNRGTSQE
jgi:hypothetical protein